MHKLSFSDINECQVNNHNCLSSQKCENTVGSYTCIRTGCEKGYSWNAEKKDCEGDSWTDFCFHMIPNLLFKNSQTKMNASLELTTVQMTPPAGILKDHLYATVGLASNMIFFRTNVSVSFNHKILRKVVDIFKTTFRYKRVFHEQAQLLTNSKMW